MSEEKLFFITELKALLTMCKVLETIKGEGGAFQEELNPEFIEEQI